MRTNWLVVVIPVWLFGIILSVTLEGTFLGASEQATLNVLVTSKVATSTSIWGVAAGLITDWSFWSELWRILWWDFAFFTGWLVVVRLVFLGLSAAIAYKILTAWKFWGSS